MLQKWTLLQHTLASILSDKIIRQTQLGLGSMNAWWNLWVGGFMLSVQETLFI